MCYLTCYVWTKCGHHVARRELCIDATDRSPPELCTSVHEPRMVSFDEGEGICSDQSKHPRIANQPVPSTQTVELGLNETVGFGSPWYTEWLATLVGTVTQRNNKSI